MEQIAENNSIDSYPGGARRDHWTFYFRVDDVLACPLDCTHHRQRCFWIWVRNKELLYSGLIEA